MGTYTGVQYLMTKQDVLATYGQSVYEIKLSIAVQQFAQLISRSGIGVSNNGDKMVLLATQALQAGTSFVNALMNEKLIDN